MTRDAACCPVVLLSFGRPFGKAAEFDRLASFDYAGFDGTQANGIMDDKTAENKLPNARRSFAKEYRFTETGTYARVGLKASINRGPSPRGPSGNSSSRRPCPPRS